MTLEAQTQVSTKIAMAINNKGRAPKRSTTKPAQAWPTPETTKNTLINKPSSENVKPNSFMNTGNISGKIRWLKCELACASPTRPMMPASWRRGTMGDEKEAAAEAVVMQAS